MLGSPRTENTVAHDLSPLGRNSDLQGRSTFLAFPLKIIPIISASSYLSLGYYYGQFMHGFILVML